MKKTIVKVLLLTRLCSLFSNDHNPQYPVRTDLNITFVSFNHTTEDETYVRYSVSSLQELERYSVQSKSKIEIPLTSTDETVLLLKQYQARLAALKEKAAQKARQKYVCTLL